MAKLALDTMLVNTDLLLARTEDPLHRKILLNWRRHSCLEVMGRYQEILAPEMTVPHPVYHFHNNEAGTVTLDGRDAVEGFYRGITEAGACVMIGLDDRIAVSDWGLAIESDFHNLMPGRVLIARGVEVDDPDAVYLVNYPQVMVWSYTPEGLLLGEDVYGGGRTVTKVAPRDVLTPAEAVEILTPILDAAPAR